MPIPLPAFRTTNRLSAPQPCGPLSRRAMLGLLGAAALVRPAFALDPADSPFDPAIRAAMLRRPNGRVAAVKTEYNDIVISKQRNQLMMLFRADGEEHTETVINLRDPDELPLHYTRAMTTALAYPAEPKRMLMVGIGGGSISTYVARAMPEIEIDMVDIDQGVIDAAKQYFGLRDTARVRTFANDGRVFIRRSANKYDIILLDAFQGSSVPAHLLTREFYALLKEKLTPTGVAAFNVHEDTRLYLSTIKTLRASFADVHLYPSGTGEAIVIGLAQAAPSPEALTAQAATLQAKHGFRYPLPDLLKRRGKEPALDKGVLLTDEYAPVDLQGANKREPAAKP